MHNDLERAKELLLAQDASCVLCKGRETRKSEERGIAPLMHWLKSGADLTGFSAADKIVGKAAALLFVRMGIGAVYAPVMSEAAIAVFAARGVEAVCEKTVPLIVNRAGTGQCPMELAVAHIDDPAEAYETLREKMMELQNGKKA